MFFTAFECLKAQIYLGHTGPVGPHQNPEVQPLLYWLFQSLFYWCWFLVSDWSKWAGSQESIIISKLPAAAANSHPEQPSRAQFATFFFC